MTNSDSTAESRRGLRLRERLPRILDARISREGYEPPTFKYVRSLHRDVKEVIAIDVELDGSLPVDMGMTPVLFVGDVEVQAVERGEKPGTLRFLVFPEEARALSEAAPMALGWPGQGPQEKATSRILFRSPEPR